MIELKQNINEVEPLQKKITRPIIFGIHSNYTNESTIIAVDQVTFDVKRY